VRGAAAERLPFADQSSTAAMAVSTVHHWHDPIAGLREMRRVARRVVVLTFDAEDSCGTAGSGLPRATCPSSAAFFRGWPRWPD